MAASLKMSVFDLDHTLLKGNSSFHFGIYLYRHNVLSLLHLPFLLLCYLLHKGHLLSLSNLHRVVFKALFRGRSFALFHSHLTNFLKKELNGLLYQPAIKMLQQAQIRGDFVAILSSSPDFLVSAIAEKLAVTHVESTIYAIDESGGFSHIEFLLEGDGKAKWVKSKSSHLCIDKSCVAAYSDSILDLPLLLAAGEPIGTNPDKRLRAVCLANNWQII